MQADSRCHLFASQFQFSAQRCHAERGLSFAQRSSTAVEASLRPAQPQIGSPRSTPALLQWLIKVHTTKTWDVIVIGGGLIGLSLAIALRKRGATVLVVERGEPGREASHAAGGMLVDCPLETAPALQQLATASAKMYPEFAHELEVEWGMKVDLRDQGTIVLLKQEHLQEHLAHPEFANFFRPADLETLEPNLGMPPYEKEIEFRGTLAEDGDEMSHEEFSEVCRTRLQNAFYLKERSVDPRALTAAALKTAKNRGIDFSSGDAVTAVNLSDGHTCGVTTTKTSFLAEKIVNCAGAWSGRIGPDPMPTRPVKGQMLCVVMQPRDLLRHVIRTPDVYLIPRSDGRLLIGATVEEAGFDKQTVPPTIQLLRHAALKIVPRLADARILEDWAGLRPGTPDSLPILGATPTPGYYVATGHFRDGILLAPITAEVMAEVIEGHIPEHDLTAFSLARFQQTD
jgi:glycine oxidase